MEPPTRKVLFISAACILAFGILAFVWFLFDHFHVFGDDYPRRFYRAVLFDQGGVLVPFKRPGDMPKFQRYLAERPAEYEAYVACERGETTFQDIAPMLEQLFPGILEVTDFEASNILSYTRPVNEDLLKAAHLIKKAGIKIGIVTNNYWWSHKRERTFLIENTTEFDVVVESCRVGVRKPDRRIYEIAVEQLGVPAEECIMVDDLMSNLHGAKAFGMATVYLPNDNTTWAIDELERMLDLKLR